MLAKLCPTSLSMPGVGFPFLALRCLHVWRDRFDERLAEAVLAGLPPLANRKRTLSTAFAILRHNATKLRRLRTKRLWLLGKRSHRTVRTAMTQWKLRSGRVGYASMRYLGISE